MKCLYIKSELFDDSFFGGVRAHMIGMANGFYDTGIETVFFTNIQLSDVRAQQILLYNVPKKLPKYLTRLTTKLYDNQIKKRTINYLKQNSDIDFIYNRMNAYMLSTLQISKKTKIPYVLEFNSSEMVMWKEIRLPQIIAEANLIKRLAARALSPYRCRSFDRKEKKLLYNAALVVTVSNVLRDELILRGVPADKIMVCPNGVDPSVFNNNRVFGETVRRSLNIPLDEIVIGFAGTFGRWHGIPELSKAITELHGVKKMSYIMIGDGLLKKQMENELSGFDDVYFLNKVPFNKMPEYLSACDILIIANSWNPSDKKPFFGSPTKMFEYMAMEKAIVASKLEQIGDVLNESNSVQFRPGDTEDLKRAVILLANDEKLRNKIGKQARIDAINKYTWKNNALRIISYMRESKNAKNTKY